jgi:signal transduction histidine kinase
MAFFIALNLHQALITSIRTLVEKIQQISQSKDYSIRCDDMKYRELDVLSQKINILLTRTEKHIAKKDNEELLTLELNHKLENKVSSRTEALKDSNQELLSTLEKLHQFQAQLVESEKLASLGDMVAGVAHEVNTPIGLGVTASTLLADRILEIKQAFENKTLKSSQLKRFLSESEENIDIVYRNLTRAANLISSFKKVAVDQANEKDRDFNVKELLDEVLLTLAPQVRKHSIEFKIICPDDLDITSKPGPIIQIMINLILNSIIHGFEHKESGVIDITIMNLSNQLHINYRDNGEGVDESIKTKVFAPFTTTKRGSGGSGLGLHLVYNLVTQALGGNIHFESERNQGVLFEISFPIINTER